MLSSNDELAGGQALSAPWFVCETVMVFFCNACTCLSNAGYLYAWNLSRV